MIRILVLLCALCAALEGQQSVRWYATTGDVSLSGAGSTATIQAPTPGSPINQIILEQAVVYCSVACNITQAANGAAATATAGTVVPILPSPANSYVPLTFWTASNVGTGTAQGGIIHVAAGGTVVICYWSGCGASANVSLGAGGASNYSVTTSSITGTFNCTFFGRVLQQ